MTVIACEDLSLSYGEVLAVDGVTFDVDAGEWVSIVGPNGAGKTSLLNLINGFNEPDSGRVTMDGTDVSLFPPWKRARLGLARTFQQGELFEHENAIENLLTVRGIQNAPNVLESLLWFGPGRRTEVENTRSVEAVLDYLELWEYRHQPVGALPLGIQKRISLGRALTTDPDILLLDEIMSGLTYDEKYDMVRFLMDLWEQENITILMIEHDLTVVTNVSERMLVLNEGQLIADGPPDAVVDDPHVKEVYTG